jgi:hypothetical protein
VSWNSLPVVEEVMMRGMQCVELCGSDQVLLPGSWSGRAVVPDVLVDRAVAGRGGDARATNQRGALAWRRGHRRAAIAVGIMSLVAGLIVGCRDNEDASLCMTDEDCHGGACLVAPVSRLSYCADASPGCPTHQRWADTAGDELAGQCVAVESTLDAGLESGGGAP